MRPVIVAEKLAAGYPGRRLVAGLTLSIEPGEVLAILGPNGAGKTTLLKTLAGMLKPLAGRVLVAGMDTRRTPRRLLARLASYVPQAASSKPRLTVLEYVLLALKAPERGPKVSEAHLSAAEEALDTLGIRRLADRGLWELSGGERQLVELARAIAPRPRAVLLDEPTSMLDPRHAVEVASAIARLADSGTAVAMVTHDPNLALDVSDSVLLLGTGGWRHGPAEELLTPENLSPLYGARLVSVEVGGGRRIVAAPLALRRARTRRTPGGGGDAAASAGSDEPSAEPATAPITGRAAPRRVGGV